MATADRAAEKTRGVQRLSIHSSIVWYPVLCTVFTISLSRAKELLAGSRTPIG